LKTAVRESEATTVVDIVRRLFDLHDKGVPEKDLQGRRKDDKKAAKSGGGESGAKE
jgi:hypothetical protein